MRPNHVAIIPDGNRRWAKKTRTPVAQAYEKGIDNIANVIRWCRECRVKTLTMWGFSTENFMRDRGEVQNLFGLFEKKLSEGLRRDYRKYNVRVRFIGDIGRLPRAIREKMRKVERDTSKNGKYRLNLLLAYGGRQELLSAVNRALLAGAKNLGEKGFASYLWTGQIGEPDLVIRTSGEKRTSGFLPWQAAYSEYHFSKKLWPEFSKRDFLRAISDYSRRKRKYGK